MAANEDVHLNNWRQHPQNQYSFVNIDKILPTQLIQRSSNPSNLESHLKDFSNFSLSHKDGHIDLSTYVSSTNTDGLIILQNGNIVYESYANKNTSSSLHIMMSMTKSVVGLVVGILASDNKLSVNDNITKHIPEVSNTAFKDVTIRQAIDMRANFIYADATHEYRYASAWNPPHETGDEKEKHHDLRAFLSNFQPLDKTDDRFEYASVNTDLIGWVCERVSGKSFAQLVQSLIWEPMGAEYPALVTVDRSGFARVSGGLCASIRDIARLGLLVNNKGCANGRQIVPAAWIDDILQGGDRDAFKRGAWAKGLAELAMDDLAYRNYCLGVGDLELVMGLGVFGQMLFADRKNGIVIVRTASEKESIDFGGIRLTVRVFQEVERVLISG